MTQPALVEVVEGLKVAFLKRNRKDARRANEVWASLAAKGPAPAIDAGLGEAIQRERRLTSTVILMPRSRARPSPPQPSDGYIYVHLHIRVRAS